MAKSALPELKPLLDMSDISKSFAGIPALRNASLHVAAGEVHALVGQNGAGKSTMIKILTGYVKRDKGDILFDGAAFEARSPQDAQAKGISTIKRSTWFLTGRLRKIFASAARGAVLACSIGIPCMKKRAP